MKTLRRSTKIIALALVFSLLFSLASCVSLGGSLKLKSFTVDRSTVKTTYFIGEEIDFSGIRATAVYTDESLNKEYTYDELEITYDEDITATVGTKEVTVSFDDPNLEKKQSFKVQITVKEDPNAVKHAGYEIDSSAVKTEYTVGDTLDFSGIKLYEKFSDGTKVEITDLALIEYVYDEGIMSEHGIATVVVNYNGERAGTVTVNVTDPSLSIVAITKIEVGGSYKNVYEIGEALDFTGITVTVTYEDGTVETLTLSSLTFSSVSTDAAGEKEVVVSFKDPVNDKSASASFTVNVIEPKSSVIQFEKDEHLIAFDSDNKTTGKHQYGETGFSGEFLLGGILYVIGDDNAFEMLPDLTVERADGTYETLAAFHSVVDIYAWVDGEYVLLDKAANSTTSYTYSLGGETLVTVDTYFGNYQFAKPIEKVKISVMPSAEYYDVAGGVNPVVLEATVIDAYNVYEAWQLAVIEKDPTRNDWDAFKNEKGIKDLDVAGIVLHRDITLREADVPASFFNYSTRDVKYFNKTTGETKIYEKGTAYLIDGTDVYSRQGGADFVIQGNYFNISLRDFPVVPSNGVFDASLDLGYGDDFSNAQFLHFEALDENWTEKPEDVPVITIENLALIGNASQDFWQEESDEGLLTAGGLILVKSSRFAETTLNNVISNSFFISYFPDYQGNMTVNNSKCYDSYQNAAFVWSSGTLTVNDSFINGAGGPAIIAMSVKNSDNVQFDPTVILNNTVVEGHLTGAEVWFKAVNASPVIDSIKALGQGLGQAGLGNFVDANGNMNIQAVLMPEADNGVASVITEATIQGTLDMNGFVFDRWYTGEKANELWLSILTHDAYAGGAPFLTVEGADGKTYTVFSDGTNLYDMDMKPLGTDPSHQALVAAFAQSEQLVLSMGGLTAVLEFYH